MTWMSLGPETDLATERTVGPDSDYTVPWVFQLSVVFPVFTINISIVYISGGRGVSSLDFPSRCRLSPEEI